MRRRQETRVLLAKAITSLTTAIAAFNAPHDVGRQTTVLLHLQHAFEMLLKAGLVESRTRVFEEALGRSISFSACIGKARTNARIHLSDAEAGLLCAIDAMRDDEQHWFNVVSEQILYLHARSAVTVFDDILLRVFRERLAEHLPVRVLPVSVEPPRDLVVLLDREFQQIKALLAPGRRARHDARARIRTLLALEAHAGAEPRVSERDVERVQRGIRDGHTREAVFPKLAGLRTQLDGEGVTIKVRFAKDPTLPAVRYEPDASTPAAAVREVDLSKKYHLSITDLGKKLGLTQPRAVALRSHLGIDVDAKCRHEFVFGSQRPVRYSDAALVRMREWLQTGDMEAVWESHKPAGRRGPRTSCSVRGCAQFPAKQPSPAV